MIKFFRNIRKNLLNEGKTTNYLKYAIGEIVLVVIGILIALQINNWNEQRILRLEEKAILEELNENLESNIEILEAYVHQQKLRQNEIRAILKHIDNRNPFSDSLGVSLRNVRKAENMSLVSSAFESLKSVGFNLIRSNKLRIRIIDLFNYDYEQYLKTINSIAEMQYQSTHDVYLKHLSYDDTTIEKVIPNNYELLLNDHEFYNLLTFRLAGKNGVITMASMLLRKTENLQKLLQNELTINPND